MLAGGIGTTPQRSMIRYATDKALKTDITLLYSNRYEDNIAFEDDFDEMQRRNKNFKVIILTITQPSQSLKGCIGRINGEMGEKAVPDYAERVFYTSGPGPMLDAMSAMLREMPPETQIKFEYFTGYAGAPKQ